MIKQFIRDQRVDLVCLQETKVQTMNTQMARSLGAGRFSEWVSVDASGSAGGRGVNEPSRARARARASSQAFF